MQVFKLCLQLLILASTVTGLVSISAFTSLVCIAVGISSYAIGINICLITAGIKKDKGIINKKKKRHKIVLLGKNKSNTIKVLIFKTLINPYISHDEFVLNNVLRKYYEMKEKIKNPETSVEYIE